MGIVIKYQLRVDMPLSQITKPNLPNPDNLLDENHFRHTGSSQFKFLLPSLLP